jgi:hypothetical protein
MTHENELKHMAVESLAQRCAQETNQYFKRKDNDTSYCFELFRRAIEEANPIAWDVICVQYQALVSGWVSKHHGFSTSGEEVEYFVNGAFGKISGTLSPDRFQSFTDLGALLRYLKMCVHSVITDYNRILEFTELFALEEAEEERSEDPSPEQQAMDHSSGQLIWEATSARLHDDKERAVIYGTFVLELKPQEIHDHFRGLFADVDEIYRVKQNVISRLRRDAEFRKLLGLDD